MKRYFSSLREEALEDDKHKDGYSESSMSKCLIYNKISTKLTKKRVLLDAAKSSNKLKQYVGVYNMF
jgi:hypothetical protein